MPGSSTLPTEDPTSCMSGAAGPLGSVASSTQNQPETCLQHGIRKPKVYTDGTVQYGMLVETGEPRDLREALSNEDWKHAIDKEFDALQKNQMWHLV
jgi:hypothetical protein